MTLEAIPDYRTELAVRESNGISVTLLRTRATNVLIVTVDDPMTGDYFELVLSDDDRPLDVFYHPSPAHGHAESRSTPTLAGRRSSSMSTVR